MPKAKASVVLVYPNLSHIGLSNMGFVSVFRELSSVPGLNCERAFLQPERTTPRTIESNLPISKFGTVAFSISFENDYLNLLKILFLSGINPLREERGEGDPLIVCGGVAPTLNPLPLVPFVDAFFLGEGESEIAKLGEALVRNAIPGKEALLEELGDSQFFFIPKYWTAGQSARPRRNWIRSLDEFETFAVVGGAKSPLGSMLLVELGRGCGRGCRFCAAGCIYRPPRNRKLDSVLGTVKRNTGDVRAVGLVSASVSDYPSIDTVSERIHALGKRVSISSMRADSVTKTASAMKSLLSTISSSGTKSIALAPEIGTERMGNVVNKRLNVRAFLDTVQAAGEAGIGEVKLYFLIGLPLEQREDIDAIGDLVSSAQNAFAGDWGSRRQRRLTVSVNPFVPKPWTPFQWAGMEREDELEEKMNIFKRSLSRKRGVKLILKSIRQAIIQAAIARGDDRLGMGLFHREKEGIQFRFALRRVGIDIENHVHEPRPVNSEFPWEIIDSGIERSFLLKEYARAKEGQSSPECDVTTCKLCGVC
ncbi:MAG: radical SAM protein [Candidatus Eisenbacteria bacterium]|nr:radical SAM protein [Candidatus Eisenbacteria bacterium]